MIWVGKDYNTTHFTVDLKRFYNSSYSKHKTKPHIISQKDFDKCYRDIPDYWKCVGPTVLHRWVE